MSFWQIISVAVIRSLHQECKTKFLLVLKEIHQVLEEKKNEITNFKEIIFIFPRILDKVLFTVNPVRIYFNYLGSIIFVG